MPLELVEATHIRVTCSGCGVNAEVCPKRELPATARASAVTKFRKAGWHFDPGEHTRDRSLEYAMREGMGRWYCPACARNTHL
jgi:hypothetical protein